MPIWCFLKCVRVCVCMSICRKSVQYKPNTALPCVHAMPKTHQYSWRAAHQLSCLHISTFSLYLQRFRSQTNPHTHMYTKQSTDEQTENTQAEHTCRIVCSLTVHILRRNQPNHFYVGIHAVQEWKGELFENPIEQCFNSMRFISKINTEIKSITTGSFSYLPIYLSIIYIQLRVLNKCLH